MFRQAARPIATFFGAGLFPRAPGTFATLAAIPLYLVLRKLSLPLYLATVGKIFITGAMAAGEMENEWGHDPSRVVIDEVCGLLVSLVSRPSGVKEIALGTALFRLFDILKPPPVGTLDRRLKGGFGIMADDVAAGIMAAGVLFLVKKSGLLR
ncbi:MAG TPA: phosphatidylglycerophosphatase A [Deltaproteobacteria bacterium]|nr:phosphatidylglycerophosphatase A [Deltaproteobacteria bacterium]HQI80581.1 phosphatidylglycerophosphatase A [Deltaproteobacteria bacterium]